MNSFRAEFKKRLGQPGLVVAPGVFEMVSLRLADRMNFEALYMTGYGTVASLMGLPDAGLATYTDMVGRVTAMAGMALRQRQVVAVVACQDGRREAGCQGQLEDQEFPKKCGHTPGRRVIPLEDMVKKIEVAVNSRTDPNFQIIARTDARTTLGLDEALRRGEAYAKAGADILFIESPESVDEMQKICQTFRGTPLVANMVEKGRTPVLSKEDLEKLGYKIAIFPVTALLASVQAMTKVYEQFKTTGSSVDQAVELYDFGDLSKLMGFEDVWEFEKKFVETK